VPESEWIDVEPVDELAIGAAMDYCETCGKFTDGETCVACGGDPVCVSCCEPRSEVDVASGMCPTCLWGPLDALENRSGDPA
jgi:hypothetical protein